MKHLIWVFFWGWMSLHAQQADTLIAPEPDMATEEVMLEQADIPVQPYTPLPAQPVALRDVDDQQWAKAASGLDYSKDVPPPPKEIKPPKADQQMPAFDWGGLSSWLGQFLQILAILLAIAGLAYAIYHNLNAPKNRQIARDGVEITLDNVEHYIHESDIDRFLREALIAGNYSLSIRLYYLQVIKQFSETGAIRWSREKTNRDYLRETRSHRAAADFRSVTRTYERVWYGNQSLDATAFAQLEPSFKELLNNLSAK